jgi:hypothetical protein
MFWLNMAFFRILYRQIRPVSRPWFFLLFAGTNFLFSSIGTIFIQPFFVVCHILARSIYRSK